MVRCLCETKFLGRLFHRKIQFWALTFYSKWHTPVDLPVQLPPFDLLSFIDQRTSQMLEYTFESAKFQGMSLEDAFSVLNLYCGSSSLSMLRRTARVFVVSLPPRGYFHIRRSGGGGGLDLTSRLEAKCGARSSEVHQIRGKTWEVLLPQDAKIGKESQFWEHLGLHLKFKGQNLEYLSPILLGLRHEFQRQILGSSPPTS